MPAVNRKPKISTQRSAAEIRTADNRALSRKFRISHLPTPALKAAMNDAAKGRLDRVDDVDAWLRSIGARD